MTGNPLFSCRVKIERAYTHLYKFQDALQAFSDSNKNSIVTDEDTEPAIKIDRFYLKEGMPSEFSSFIGDIAHNLRSALDSLALKLIENGGIEPLPLSEQVMSETYFPINWQPGFTSEKDAKLFARIGPDAEKIVRAIEPYKGGKGDKLFRLHRLNIIDKHRAIVPVAAAFHGVTYWLPGESPEALPPRPEAFKPKFPLKDGDELSRRGFHEAEYRANAHFSLQIAFGEGQVFEGASVLDTFYNLLELVEGTISTFATDIFKCH
jgi:hypothetical protein